MNQQDQFDVFVSYADTDREWTETWLIPRLNAANFSVCTERETFDIGVPRVVNTERAVAQSRHTLIVLSPAWLASEWAGFAGLLAQTTDPAANDRRILPLLLQACVSSRRISMLHAADFTVPEHREARLQRVIAAINGHLNLTDVSAPLSVILGPEGRNRRAMLRKVRTIWIDGLLKHSLYQEILIALGLHERPDAVARPLDVLVHFPNQTDKPLPPDKRIIEVFDECDGALLILGAPGAGKTTLLLELARDLLDRAEQDSSHPIPVVFPLSSWAERRLPLVEWLVDELNKRYDVPRKLAQSWVAGDTILPLLDGLDEVKADVRRTCVETVNTYRQEHGLLSLVMSSRIADYDVLSVKLRLQSAIVVQPLTREQVKDYLWQVGLRVAPSSTSPLWDLLDTPLMLNIATLTYVEQAGPIFQGTGTLEQHRDQLFAAYIERMFQRRGFNSRFSPEEVVDSLAWLAWQMKRRSESTFFLKQLQPDWLQNRVHRIVSRVMGIAGIPMALVTVMFGVTLLIGLLIEPVAQFSFGQLRGVPAWAIVGLVGGCLGSMVYGMVGMVGESLSPDITFFQETRWSRSGVWTGMLVMLVSILWGLWRYEGLIWVNGLLFAIIAGVTLGVQNSGEVVDATPNQSVLRSLRMTFYISAMSTIPLFIVGLLLGLIFPQGFVEGLAMSFVFTGIGLSLGVSKAGHAVIKHYILRLILWHSRVIPWNFIDFLDYATDLIFLRKVGGGYIFIHRLLLDYFAAQYTGPEIAELRATNENT